MKKLIINADDFGMSKVFNEKILELLENGFIKSTTVMVNRITKEQNDHLKRLIGMYKIVSIGLHLEFNIEEQIEMKIKDQYQKFISIFKFPPSHFDVHKLINSKEVIMKVNKAVEEYNLPVRNHGIKARVKQTSYPAFMPINFDINEIIGFFKNMKDNKSYELITHPGEYDQNCNSSLNERRIIEYKNIIKLQDYIKSHKDIRNISYLEL